MDTKVMRGSLQRLSEQDSRLESEDSRMMPDEQEALMDVAGDVMSVTAVKLKRLGVQIIPLDKLQKLEFSMSRDIISPFNADINIYDSIKVQLRDLESPSIFTLFDRYDIDVQPLSIHATVQDLEVLKGILSS